MKNKLSMTIVLGILVSGCLTLSGNYRFEAYDANGQEITSKIQYSAHGRGIYTVRNAFCSSHKGATLRIIDADTGKELKSESPYKCR